MPGTPELNILDPDQQQSPGMPGDTAALANPGSVPPFNVIIPKPFKLADQDKKDLDKIKDEIVERVQQWETKMSGFFLEYEIFADSYRMINKRASAKPRGIFNSKSGETHRAAETMATLWFRMLTGNDPYFEAVASGLDAWGMEPTEEDLYGTEALLARQLQKTRFKEKLLRGLTSLALFGHMICEEPWVSFPYGDGRKSFQGTDLVPRSLLLTAFDPFVFDLDMSDYMATIDFPTKWRMRNLASGDATIWNQAEVEKQIDTQNKGTYSTIGATYAYSRVLNRKQRAGLTAQDSGLSELISYHGRIDIENPIIGAMWESLGRQDDPKYCDFTFKIMNGDGIVCAFPTPYRTWHSMFKTCGYKLFELEGLGYGVGKIGRRLQRELDITQSQINNLLILAVMSMWKVGRFAGLRANQLNIKPNQVVELDDISQLEPLRPPIEAIATAVNMMNGWKEDFRSSTGASANLQAVTTGASATEAGLTQNESIRGGSVHAEIIAETFLREHIETCYQNNLELLDDGIWVSIAGSLRPKPYSKDNLSPNVGFRIRTSTDKDFRPQRQQALMEGLQMATSIRNVIPGSINMIQPLVEEYFRTLGINPRRLNAPMPVAEQFKAALQSAQANPQSAANMQGQPGQEAGAEQAGNVMGAGAQVRTPVGPVPTSSTPVSLIHGV